MKSLQQKYHMCQDISDKSLLYTLQHEHFIFTIRIKLSMYVYSISKWFSFHFYKPHRALKIWYVKTVTFTSSAAKLNEHHTRIIVSRFGMKTTTCLHTTYTWHITAYIPGRSLGMHIVMLIILRTGWLCTAHVWESEMHKTRQNAPLVRSKLMCELINPPVHLWFDLNMWRKSTGDIIYIY